MANGIEDLNEKNQESQENLENVNFAQWTNFQGREDAEMLYEKKISSSKKFRSQKDYEQSFEDF